MEKESNRNLKIGSDAIVCAERSELKGSVTIGPKTIVHPTVRIVANNGPVVIGESNLIEEYVTIVNNNTEPMVIGSFNVFEVGCYSECPKMGDCNVLESKSILGANVTLGDGCVIGAKCMVNWAEKLPDNTVVYGPDCKRRIQSEKPIVQTLQLEFLRKIMPNYQNLLQE